MDWPTSRIGVRRSQQRAQLLKAHGVRNVDEDVTVHHDLNLDDVPTDCTFEIPLQANSSFRCVLN